MKKQTVVMLWSCAVLLVVVSCVGVYIKSRIDEGSKNSNIEVFECAVSDISGYAVKSDSGEYKLIRDSGGWHVEGNSVAVIDTKKADELIGYAALITANGIAADNVYESTVQKTITIFLSDGDEKTVSFMGESGDTCAFAVSGDDNVYTMYTSNRDILTPNLDSIRKPDIFEFSDNNAENLNLYEYKDYDGSVISVRLKNGDELAESGTNKYIMTNPYLRSVDDERFEQQIAVKLPAIKAARFVDDFPEELSRYGLDEETSAVLTVGNGDKINILRLGKNDGGLVYAMKEGADGVFAINSSQLEFLQTEPFYIVEGSLLKAEIKNVNRIVIERENEKYDIRRSPADSGGNRFYINDRDSGREAFDEIVKILSEVNILSELATVPENTADIVVRVYYDNSAAVQNIELALAGDKTYAAFVNDKAEFAVDKKVIDDIIKQIAEISSEPLKLNKKGN